MIYMERLIQWIFALIMAAVGFGVSMVIFMFLGLKLAGMHIGVPADPGRHFDGDPIGSLIYIATAVAASIIVAAVLGVITAPKPQRRLAACVFPGVIFLSIMVPLNWNRPGFPIFDRVSLLIFASCASVSLYFLIRAWRRPKPPV